MNDTPIDPFEQRLGAHLHRRAETITPADPTTVDIELDELRRAADTHSQRTRQRRLGALSVVSVAASAILIAAVIGAQTPRPVDSGLDPASGISGVATGSSTGSATGSAKGWTSSEADLATSELPRRWLELPGLGDAQLESLYGSASEQRTGRDAPDIAVLASFELGRPLAFVTASVQRPGHIGMGSGGEMGSIDGRPARTIVGNEGWQRVIWDRDDETRVLLQAYGVDRATLEAAATSLHLEDGTWVMEPGASGLVRQGSVAPTEQRAASFHWTDRATESYASLELVTGGGYELWASLASSVRSGGGGPSVVEVGLGDGTTALGVLTSSTYGQGSDAQVLLVDPDGVVVKVLLSQSFAADSADVLRANLATMLVEIDDARWADLLRLGAERRAAMDGAKIRERAMAEGATTTVVEVPGGGGSLRPDGGVADLGPSIDPAAPPATIAAPTTSEAPSTTAPATTAPATTSPAR